MCQLADDLRNDLNAAELQSAYLIEIAENDEVKEEVKRLRGMISQFGLHLQSVTAALSPAKLTTISYKSGEFVGFARKTGGRVSGPERKGGMEGCRRK